MIFFGVKVSDRGCLRFLVHFHHRDIADVEMIDQILALRGNNDLCVYGRILNHFCQLADGIGMQAKFRFIQNDDVGHCLGRLQKQGGQGNETDRSVGELVGIETIVRGRIIYPPERNDTTHGLQIEVLELGNCVTDIVNNPVVGIRATGGNWPSRRDKPDVAAPLSMNRETDIPCSKKASGK